MRKIAAVLMLVLIVASNAFASAIVTTGFGSTEEEASLDARSRLESLLFRDLIGRELPEVRILVDADGKGGFTAAAQILESSESVYIQELKKLKASIEGGYKTLEQDVEHLSRFAEDMFAYDCYRLVLLLLDSNTNAPDLEVPTTMVTLQNRIMNLLIQNGMDTSQLEDQLERGLLLFETLVRKTVEKQLGRIVLPSPVSFDNTSFRSTVEAVLKANADLSDMTKQYDSLLKAASKKINGIRSAMVPGIEARPYRPDELDKNGSPKKKVVAAREKEKNAIKERMDGFLEEVTALIQNGVGPSISESYSTFLSAIETLNKGSFSLSTADGSLSVIFDPFSEATFSWRFTAYPEGFVEPIAIDAVLLFDQLDKKGHKKYKGEALSEAVKGYEVQLNGMDASSVYSITAEVSVKFDKTFGGIAVTMEKLYLLDSTKKKGKVKLDYPAKSEEIFFESYIPLDMNEFAFALDKGQLRGLNKEMSKKQTRQTVKKVGSFINSIELYAMANGRIGLGVIPEAARTSDSPVGFCYAGGADVFVRAGRVLLGVQPAIGGVFNQTVMDLNYEVGAGIYAKDSTELELGYVVLRYGMNQGHRFELAYRGLTTREPKKTLDLTSYYEVGITFYPEFNYIPGIYFCFGIGGGLGFAD